jgi:hypothetical protein
MEILGKEYNLKFGLRSMFIYESITGNTFNIKTIFDEYVYFYACLLADTTNPALDFEEFINYCDEHPELLKAFDEALLAEAKRKEMLSNKDKKKAKSTKK